jgi:hypothetical protein
LSGRVVVTGGADLIVIDDHGRRHLGRVGRAGDGQRAVVLLGRRRIAGTGLAGVAPAHAVALADALRKASSSFIEAVQSVFHFGCVQTLDQYSTDVTWAFLWAAIKETFV